MSQSIENQIQSLTQARAQAAAGESTQARAESTQAESIRAESTQTRVLIVLTSHDRKGNTGQPTGFYLSEVTHPLEKFEAAGFVVQFASIQGGKPPVDGLNLDDPVNARYWHDDAFRSAIANTASVDQLDAKQFDGIFFAGGHGTMWDFRDSPGAQQLTRSIYENGGVIGAVCHGPAALVDVKLSDGTYLVAGKRVSAFTDAEEQAVGLANEVPFLLASTLEKRGAIHVPAANWERQVIVDGRIVTGQNPASAAGVGDAMVAELLARR